MKLFVDDFREAPKGWVLAKTITQAIKILSTMSVDEVSLDHDIIFETADRKIGFSEENFTAVAWHIAAMPEEIRPKTVFIHTANPTGAKNIESILEKYVPKLIRDTSYCHEWKIDPDIYHNENNID
jgi:GDP-D-mannose dehydratase